MSYAISFWSANFYPELIFNYWNSFANCCTVCWLEPTMDRMICFWYMTRGIYFEHPPPTLQIILVFCSTQGEAAQWQGWLEDPHKTNFLKIITKNNAILRLFSLFLMQFSFFFLFNSFFFRQRSWHYGIIILKHYCCFYVVQYGEAGKRDIGTTHKVIGARNNSENNVSTRLKCLLHILT